MTADLLPAARRDPVELVAQIGHLESLAHQVAGTVFVPENMRNDPTKVVAVFMLGLEVGLGPMTSLQYIVVNEYEGPSMKAEGMRALVQANGHKIWATESTDDHVTMRGQRLISENPPEYGPIEEVTYSMGDAQKAGLLSPSKRGKYRQGWTKNPKDMLYARASSRLCRRMFADCLGGISYVPGETADQVEAVEHVTAQVIDQQPAAEQSEVLKARRPAQRKRELPAPTSTPEPDLTPPVQVGEVVGEAVADMLPDLPQPELLPPPASDDAPHPAETAEPADGDVTDQASKLQRKQFALIRQAFPDETGDQLTNIRHALAWLISQGRTTSSSSLTTDELSRMCDRLEDIADADNAASYIADDEGVEFMWQASDGKDRSKRVEWEQIA